MPSFGGVAKEAVTFLISGDASGLIKTFGDVEKAADKSLGKTQTTIEKFESSLTKIGAASIGAGLSTALGLVSTIKDFEDTEAAANKLDTAVKGMGSNIDTAKIKDLAFQLQQVSKFTDDQVVSAARWGAVYGLTTDQLSQLLKVAVDLSAQTGQSLDKVTKQLASVATGGSDKMLKKWGVQFDETALKANAFAETMKAAGDFSGGAAAKSVDSFSGQLTRLHNNFDDVKSQIGKGANEVFEPIVRGAADMAESLAKANPALLQTVGHFTAIGSIGVTAFGGLATAAGQIVNIQQAAQGLGLKFKDAEGNLTGLSKGLIGLGAVGAAAAIYEVGKGLEDATENTRGFDAALKQLSVAKNIDEQGKAIKTMAEDTQGWFDKTTAWLGSIGSAGDVTVKIGASVVAVKQLNEAFDQMADKDPATALASIGPALDSVTEKSREWNAAFNASNTLLRMNPYDDTAKHLKDLQGDLEKSATAANKAGDRTGHVRREGPTAGHGLR